jgi:outer membrane murein-binding lipoprotein Lpp
MKNSIVLFIVTTFLVGTIVAGCQTSAEKVDAAKSDVADAKQDLKEVKAEANEDAQKAANEAAWKAYKVEAEAKIDANDALIEDIKVKMKKSGKTMDALYRQQIDVLEQKNKELRERIDVYNTQMQSDWESFKREFDHDMDELGAALKDLTVNNKK